MKTKLLISGILLLSILHPFNLHAQIKTGTHHGIAVSTLSKTGDLYDNDHLVANYTGGFYLLYPISKTIALEPELNYLRKGRNEITPSAANEGSANVNLDYIQLPVMFRYTSQVAGKYSLFLHTGPYVSALVNAEKKYQDLESNKSITEKLKKNPDLGMILGLGMDIPTRLFDLELNLRYDMGLSKIDGIPSDFRTKTMSLTAGIMF